MTTWQRILSKLLGTYEVNLANEEYRAGKAEYYRLHRAWYDSPEQVQRRQREFEISLLRGSLIATRKRHHIQALRTKRPWR